MESQPTRRSSSILRNRLSNISLASIRSLLPQYTVVDNLEEPASTSLAVNTNSPVPPPYASAPSSSISISRSPTPSQITPQPPRYSLLYRPRGPERGEVTLTWRASTSTPFEIEDDTHAQAGFRYWYPIKPKKPWATLHLQTREAVPGNPKPSQSQPRVPKFWSCDPVIGSVGLDLDAPQIIQQIVVSLTGSIVMSSVSEVQFLGHEFTLWDRLMGDPRSDEDVNNTQKNRTDGRFTPGQYNFPFSFPFPTHPRTSGLDGSSISPFPPPAVGLSQGTLHERYGEKSTRITQASRLALPNMSPSPGKAETDPSSSQVQVSDQPPSSALVPRARHSLASPLPQSFMEKSVNPSISYEISVRILHGRFKASSRIKTNIVYVPAFRPLPSPQKRRDAYEAGASLPYPLDHPEVWFTWPTLTLYGIVNSDARPRHTKADCTLFLAQPLSYTRGSVIPCFLTISSDDEEVVRLLSNPKAPAVRLLRRIRHPMEEDQAAPERMSEDPGDLTNSWTWKTWRPHTTSTPSAQTKLIKHEAGRAQWWSPLKHIPQSANVKHLEGEIHLNHRLQPSCDFQSFQIEYAVDLLSFQTADFEHKVHPSPLGNFHQRDNVLASNVVEITTLYREDEPIPAAYSEPPGINIARSINPEDKAAAISEETSAILDSGP